MDRNTNAAADLQCRLAAALVDALLRTGFWHRGRLCLHYAEAMGILFPELFRDRPTPDAALIAPGNTPARLQELIARDDAGLALWHPDDRPRFQPRENELGERVGITLMPAARHKVHKERADFMAVVETWNSRAAEDLGADDPED